MTTSRHARRALGVAGIVSMVVACGSRSGLLGLEAEPIEGGPLAIEPSLELPPRQVELPGPIDLDPPPEPEEPEPTLSGCVDITRHYESIPATVLLLIDQSQSMAGRFGRSTRWDVLRDAIVDPDDGLLEWLDEGSRVGLMLYTSINGFQEGGACPMLVRADARIGAAEQIRGTYLSESPREGGDTPTAEAIDAAVRYVQGLPPLGPRYILLLTDGLPDTCTVPDPQWGLDEAVTAARAAFDSGIRLYTVGVSREISRRGLQRVANAGAGKPAGLRFGIDDAAEEPLYASADPRELAQQLRGVIGDVRTCLVDLETFVGRERVLEGQFVLDGATLEHGDVDGWTFVDDHTVQIHGASCDRILGEGQQLEVTFPCVESFSAPR